MTILKRLHALVAYAISEKTNAPEPRVEMREQGAKLKALPAVDMHIGEEALEAVLYDLRARPHWWLERLYQSCGGVARLDLRDGTAVGTGFLVRARDLGLVELGDEPVLLTSNHVMRDGYSRGRGSNIIRSPANMEVRFEARNDGIVYRPVIVFESSPDECDFSVARLWPRIGVGDKGVLEIADDDLPDEVPGARGRMRYPRVFVPSHPNGGTLSMALENNLYRGIIPGPDDVDYIAHTAPTDYGSSGAPVLTESITVCGVHRAAGQVLQAGSLADAPKAKLNLAVSIQSIRRAIARR